MPPASRLRVDETDVAEVARVAGKGGATVGRRSARSHNRVRQGTDASSRKQQCDRVSSHFSTRHASPVAMRCDDRFAARSVVFVPHGSARTWLTSRCAYCAEATSSRHGAGALSGCADEGGRSLRIVGSQSGLKSFQSGLGPDTAIARSVWEGLQPQPNRSDAATSTSLLRNMVDPLAMMIARSLYISRRALAAVKWRDASPRATIPQRRPNLAAACSIAQQVFAQRRVVGRQWLG